MNVKEYIASGILEAYALGSCAQAEKEEVEAKLAQYPELREELRLIEQSLGTYASLYAKEPPAGLQNKIASALFGNEENKGKVIGLRPNALTLPRWLAAAAAALLLATTFSAIVLYSMLSDSNERFAETEKENSLLNSSLAQRDSAIGSMNKEMALLKDPMSQLIVLKGMKKAPDAKAMVVWNKKTNEVYLEVERLPQAPKGMQYQFWAIVDGKPVDAGMIHTDSAGMHRMKDFEKADAFAITLEKEGGSPVPNLEEMYAMGKP